MAAMQHYFSNSIVICDYAPGRSCLSPEWRMAEAAYAVVFKGEVVEGFERER
jgi:hypothetical protein